MQRNLHRAACQVLLYAKHHPMSFIAWASHCKRTPPTYTRCDKKIR